MSSNATPAPALAEVPTGPSFGSGLLQAVAVPNAPPVVVSPSAPTPDVQMSAPSGSPTPANVSEAPAGTDQVLPSMASGSSRRVTRASSGQNALDAPAPPVAKARAPPKRTRTATAVEIASAESALSAGVAFGLHERVSALQDDTDALASHLRDNSQRIDDLTVDTNTRISSLREDLASLLGMRAELKQLRIDVQQDIRSLGDEVREGQVLTAARLRALECAGDDVGNPPAKRPRLGEGHALITASPATPAAVPQPSTMAQATPLPLAPAAGYPTAQPGMVPAPDPVVPPPPSLPSPVQFLQVQAPPASVLPVQPLQVQAPPAPVLPIQPMPATAPAVAVTPPAPIVAPAPVAAPPAAFAPALTTPRGTRRNYHIRFGPISCGGAAPLAVVHALLSLMPNGSLLAKLVKDAQLFPTDFTYLLATTFAYDHAAGIVEAWNTTRPETYASVSAEFMRGN